VAAVAAVALAAAGNDLAKVRAVVDRFPEGVEACTASFARRRSRAHTASSR
jgi:hypothetical protein